MIGLLIESVAERIGNEVPALVGRVEYVAELAELIEQQKLPQSEVAAFVVPLGFDDTGGDVATGAHAQMLSTAVGVCLVVKSPGDAKGKKAVVRLEALIDAVVRAIAGWTPVDSVGVFRVNRGRLAAVNAGVAIYQIDFQLFDQLRIA